MLHPTRAQKAEARRMALFLVKHRGFTVPAAKAAVFAAIKRAAEHRAGLGDETFIPVTPEQSILERAAQHEVVKNVRETVSPCLWVLSIVSFGMAVVNRRQIATMFGNWRRRNRPKTA